MEGDIFMKRKKLILLLVFALIISILSGCSEAPKAPEGVSQEFYDDMLDVLKKLEKTKDKESTNEENGKDIIDKYKKDKLWLQPKEQEIIDAIDDMHLMVRLYYASDTANDMIVKHDINLVAELMELDIDVDKLMKK
jgi:hypothetical protein